MASLIGSYVHLPGKHRDQHALFILRKVASLVKPIMVQRGYRVGQLAEFFPTEHNLLGLNVDGGQKILLRLRPHYDDHSFLPLDDVVFTMLHELTHNEFGPHDEKFYNRLKELEEDYYKLRASGYSGEGFYSEGKRLGVGVSHNPRNFTEARRRALAAAEKRRVLNSGSSQKLGGGGVFFGGTPQQRAAAAAERRARDNKACGASSHAGNRGHIQREAEESLRNGFTTKAEDDNADEEATLKAAIELIECEGDGHSWREKNGYIFVDDDDESPPRLPKRPRSPTTNSKMPQQGSPVHKPSTWTCSACTLVNPEQYLQCEVCNTVRPSPPIPESTRPTAPTKKTTSARPINSNPVAAAAQARHLKFQQEKKKKESLAQAQLARIPEPKHSVWKCSACTKHNSSEWWTCQVCGTMKTSS